MSAIQDLLNSTGYAIVPKVYSNQEIHEICSLISKIHGDQKLFGERRFLQRTPGLQELLLNSVMRNILNDVAPDYFIIKSIYFDKPPQSNWLVSWHQDKTIFVKERIETAGFRNWTRKENEFGVQPPVEYLGNIVTIRIHLDDTDETNGALKVIPHSHSESSSRPESISLSDSEAVVCPVKAGGIMLMKPLLFHSSARSTSLTRRRVLHLELCNMDLPNGLEWS